MSTPFQNAEGAIVGLLTSTPSRIPVVVGPCGAGRTSLLQRLKVRLGAGDSQYVALDHAVSTPERFLEQLSAASPFRLDRSPAAPEGPRDAFDRIAAWLTDARTAGGTPSTWLLDEFLEFKTFESFPGLRRVVGEALAVLAASPNRFVLSSRFVARALRALRDADPRFVVVHVPPLTAPDVAADLLRLPGFRSDSAEQTAGVIVALTGGRAAYAADLVRVLGEPGLGAHDAVSAFAAALTPGGALVARCRHAYEFRLHRARGYGALKAILGILADDEPMTLTDVAGRMRRTPGSTKDYLGWLEDVDLVVSHRKRYSFADPVLRLWVKLHTGCEDPDDARVTDLVQRYAVVRLSAAPELP